MVLLCTFSLSLLLTCLAGTLASEREQGRTSEETTPYGPSFVKISGVNTVTVEVPYGFQCSANCFPACTFTWTRGGLTTQGPELNLQLKEQVPPQVLICMAINPTTGKSVTVSKTVNVTAGPSNIKITGPDTLSSGVTSNFSCSADCYPSCSYTWTISSEAQSTVTTKYGQTISVTPDSWEIAEELICEAQDTVSLLFISTYVTPYVARGPEAISITGSSSVTVGDTYNFVCLVDCTPSCTFTWTFNGKIFNGDEIQLPIFHKGDKPVVGSKLVVTVDEYRHNEALTCEAKNVASGVTAVSTKILTVTDPISVQPVSQNKPLAHQPFSLQCVGSQNPSSILWLKNGLPIAVSGRVSLSPNNITMSFSPLLQSDGGLYQCIVSQGGAPIKGVGYQLNVNYGPLQAVIIQSGKGPVGKVLYLLPGSKTDLQCSALCYPTCTYTWIYKGRLAEMNASFSLTPETTMDGGPLSCVAYNSVTNDNSTANTSVVLIDGPSNMTISGPGALEVGIKASFKCIAQCSPSCSYTWSVYGRTMHGSVVDITVNRYVATESFSCEAHNTITGKTATANETLSVTDSLWCGC
ncbi:hemicentin-1 [Salmo trutta]|uniref:hemicentin-1 n=1 Tax=Salmo trutta TaxID=8032 RepID=UPI001131632D|nr:hemicentin-1-like [Salmo trutta]